MDNPEENSEGTGPSIFWAEENDWDTKLGIRFRLEVQLGKLTDIKLF